MVESVIKHMMNIVYILIFLKSNSVQLLLLTLTSWTVYNIFVILHLTEQ